MAALSPSRRQVVHDCISTALRELIGGHPAAAYAPPHSERLHTSPSSSENEALGHADEFMSRSVAALRCVFDKAISSVCEEWNANHRDPLLSLPVELVTECFRQLTPRQCITISHVSQAWRRAALSDGWLWTEFEIPEKPRSIEREVHALSTLLSRSYPAPFELVCSLPAYSIPDAIYDLVATNLHRMAALEFTGGVQISRVLRAASDAPQLKTLGYNAEEIFESSVFPAGWGSRNAPRLQYLSVSNFALPSDTPPFAALRELHARLAPGRIPAIAFSTVFPNLTWLDLRPMTQDMVPMLTPLPPSLRELSLVGGAEQVDYSPIFIPQPVPCGIRQLILRRASGFQAALELFVRMCAGPWKLQFNGDNRVAMKDLAEAVTWRISCWAAVSLAADEGFTAHLGRLAELELPLDAFIELHRVSDTVWDRALPALHALKLTFPPTCEPDDWTPIIDSASDVSAGLLMPALRYVELLVSSSKGPAYTQCDCMFNAWLRRDAPSVMARLFSSLAANEQSIGHILIQRGSDLEISRGDVAFLLQLAERVLIGTSPYSENLELVFERSTTSSE